jgi:hypothetical protein
MLHASVAGAVRWPASIGVLILLSVGLTMPAHAANQRPTISGTPPTSVYVGSQYYFQAQGYDPEGAPLRYSIQNKPSWAIFATTTGVLSGTPTASGSWTNIRITVSDGTSTSRSLRFSISAIAPSNVAPVISGTPPTAVVAGSTYSFAPDASDANGDPLVFSIANRPAWASFDTLTGRLSGTPDAASVGIYPSVTICVSDGKASAALAPFTITVAAAPNAAPTISGTPATSVNAGSAYSFRPSAADANGDTLTFLIANAPAWATFNVATGQLSGTPTSTHVGTYSNVIISVSDGKASAALAPFAITVVSASIGTAAITWTPPTANTDGSTLTDLAGYRILYGVSAAQLTQTIQVASAGISSYVVENLAPGTYYFAVRAYTSGGAESVSSNVVTKVVQ